MRKGIADCPIVILLLMLLFASPVEGKEASLDDIVVTSTRDHLLLYFSVKDCFTTEMIQAIQSGIETTFTFYVQLDRRRDFWWDKEIVDTEVRHSIQYDNLKQTYRVTLSEQDGKSLTVQDFDEAKRLMSDVVALKVLPLRELAKGGHYRIHMMAELDQIRLPLYLHYVFFFLSLWDFETDWYTIDFRY